MAGSQLPGTGARWAWWSASLTWMLAGCVTAPLPAETAPVVIPVPVVSVPAPPPPPPAPPVATASDLATRHVLAATERVRSLPPAELARELARLGDGSAGPQATMELAVALAQSPHPADTVRALVLLDGLQRNPSPDAAAWHPVARLLAAGLAEQRRLEETVERQNQQLRDQQRRLEQLNDKLEALKAIERNLVTRPGAAPGPVRSAP